MTPSEQSYSYTKKPVTIHAVCNVGKWKPVYEFLVYLSGGEPAIPPGARPSITRNDDGSLNIDTLEGRMRCDVGDWLICGVKGEFYPCKPDIFQAIYDPGTRK
jgi:hypothetical protein